MATNKDILKILDCVESKLMSGELEEIHQTVKEIKEVMDVDLDLVWDPPWDKSMMSESAKLELNLLQIQ